MSDKEQAPGLTYMIATGHPADGSHSDLEASTQHLVNPRVVNPNNGDSVRAWVRHRARADEQMQTAGARRAHQNAGER